MGYRLIEVGGSNPAPIQQQLLFVLLLLLKGGVTQKKSVCGELPDNHDNFKHPY